jgi:hypothetical protein
MPQHTQSNAAASETDANAMPPTPTPTPTPIVKEKSASRAPSKPEDVDQQVWNDWLQLRKGKKAAVTETVIAGAAQQAQIAGMGLNDFLAVWCRRGSQGLEAAWLRPEEKPTQLKKSHKEYQVEEPA